MIFLAKLGVTREIIGHQLQKAGEALGSSMETEIFTSFGSRVANVHLVQIIPSPWHWRSVSVYVCWYGTMRVDFLKTWSLESELCSEHTYHTLGTDIEDLDGKLWDNYAFNMLYRTGCCIDLVSTLQFCCSFDGEESGEYLSPSPYQPYRARPEKPG